MLTGAQCNGVCECPNANGRESCGKIINLNDEKDCFLVGQISFECKEVKCQCADGFYQRFSNVCRRESIQNEPFNIDSIELSSIGAETNSICTSVSTQTPSVKDATIQTTHSLESLTAESPSDLKFSSFSNRRIRNYINYSKLVNSEFTKTSSIESSFKDESTQFGESCESENKSCSGHKHNYCRKSICQCQDPFYPKDEICKDDLSDVAEDEICYGNGHVNSKAHKCSHCKSDHLCYPESMNSFSRRISLGLHSHANQYLPFNPIYYDKQSSIICPCYNLLRFNPVIEKCDFKHENEQCTDKFQVNNINNNKLFDNNSQRSTLDYKENFNAQQLKLQQLQKQYSFDVSKIQAENEPINNRAFANDEYKIDILDEKTMKSQIKSDYIDNDKDLEKEPDFPEEIEQSRPLLGDKSFSMDRRDVSTSRESIAVGNEAVNNEEPTTECANGCHCHQHDYTPIRPRPTKKSNFHEF
ncbi:hypothetical protein ACKWTF_004479 [Chironomus riparius]